MILFNFGFNYIKVCSKIHVSKNFRKNVSSIFNIVFMFFIYYEKGYHSIY